MRITQHFHSICDLPCLKVYLKCNNISNIWFTVPASLFWETWIQEGGRWRYNLDPGEMADNEEIPPQMWRKLLLKTMELDPPDHKKILILIAKMKFILVSRTLATVDQGWTTVEPPDVDPDLYQNAILKIKNEWTTDGVDRRAKVWKFAKHDRNTNQKIGRTYLSPAEGCQSSVAGSRRYDAIARSGKHRLLCWYPWVDGKIERRQK
jgi:hypothetical protein